MYTGHPIQRATWWASLIGGTAAFIAIAIGLYGDGAMFPSLLIGYTISGTSALVFLEAYASKPDEALASDARPFQGDRIDEELVMKLSLNSNTQVLHLQTYD